MTTELGSFDASRLGAFTASQFGDARNRAMPGPSGFYLNISLMYPPEGMYGWPEFHSLFEEDAADFALQMNLATNPGVNLLIYTPDIGDDEPGIHHAGIGNVPNDIIAVQIPYPRTFRDTFSAIEGAMAGKPDPVAFTFEGNQASTVFPPPPPTDFPTSLQRTQTRWPHAIEIRTGQDYRWLRSLSNGVAAMGR